MGITYSVDVAALREYAASEEASRTKASTEEKEIRSEMTHRELINRFLQYVQPTVSGDGLCTVSYTRSDIGQALVEAGFIKNARLYPDKWPSCATGLGSDLRSLALGKFYCEMDDANAFHKLLQARTQNQEAKALIERIISDHSLKPSLSEHYFDTPDRTKDIKKLLHSMSNGGSPAKWRERCGVSRNDDPDFILDLHRAMCDVTRELAQAGVGPDAVRFIAERFPTKTKRVPDPQPGNPNKMKEVEIPRDPLRCWKSYVLQQDEVHGLFAKMRVASRLAVPCGPPLHDCLFVEKAHGSKELAAAMSEAIMAASRVPMQVNVKEIQPYTERRAFQLEFNSAKFDEKEFVPNSHLASQEDIDVSLAEYNRWFTRFFVCIIEETNPMVAQVFYFPGSDRVQNVICRNPADTRCTFLEMEIILEPAVDAKRAPKTAPLLSWYMQKNIERRTAAHVNMWTSPDDIAKHPEDLNVFGGLEFDSRFTRDSDKPSPTPFADPFPTGALPRVVAGLKPTPTQSAITGPHAEWRDLEGVSFIMWHLKYILCGGDNHAFVYLIQWFGHNFQTRRKPGVMPQFLGDEGTGKSAIFGHNQSGPGLIARIYGQYFQWSDDIDSLTGKFNRDSMNRLFCVMEEAGTYRKGHRDNNKLKSMITEGTMLVEIKNVNQIRMNDNRAFAMLTNNRDSLKVTDGARRFLCCEGNGELSQKAVDEGHCNRETRREYMSKLDKTKNDDEVAYAFFKICMSLDLSGFHIDEPPRTDFFEEQRSHNECALKRFLLDAQSGAYLMKADEYNVLRGEQKLTALQLFTHLRRYVADTGTYSTIDSAMSLGHTLTKKYQALAPKIEGRVAKYKFSLPEESIN